MVTASSGYLLDTNVISELMKPRPARSVADWIVSTPATALHHGLTFVTRNTADVRLTGVPLFNPG